MASWATDATACEDMGLGQDHRRIGTISSTLAEAARNEGKVPVARGGGDQWTNMHFKITLMRGGAYFQVAKVTWRKL